MDRADVEKIAFKEICARAKLSEKLKKFVKLKSIERRDIEYTPNMDYLEALESGKIETREAWVARYADKTKPVDVW